MIAYIGIDPGFSGALAYLDGDYADLRDMPTFALKKRTALDIATLANMLAYEWNIGPRTHHAVVEDVAARPGQGVTSMFRFGESKGVVLGSLAALQCPYTLVPPSKWRPAMVGRGADKEAARQRAMQLFPQCAGELSRKKDSGRAEALLLALYGKKNNL